MTKREQLLYRIMQVPGTINNHYSREAKSTNGSLLQAGKYFRSFEKSGFIRKAVYDFEPSNKRREIIYFITHKGARHIGMDDEYKYKEFKASANTKHNSMVADVALSFLHLYPEWEFDFEFNSDFQGKRPDIFINMKREHFLYKFWVEVERKKECYKGVMSKVGSIGKLKLPKNTKILFVLCTPFVDPFIRPTEYQDTAHRLRIEDNNKQFNRFVKSKLNIGSDYLFLNFINYHRLNEAVWFDHKGQPRKLIQ